MFDRRCSIDVVLPERRRARPRTLPFGTFKSVSGNFNLFSDLNIFLDLFWGVLKFGIMGFNDHCCRISEVSQESMLVI